VPVDRPIPVIDIFAGPGGLGEGFSALGRPEGKPRFSIRLSIEKDPLAHQTLELRAFFRQFPHGEAPPEYYEHLRGRLARNDLFDAWAKAA
jgi:DNA (cytosine-5)-methyltransferase 1